MVAQASCLRNSTLILKSYQAGCLAYYKSFAVLYGSASILLAE